MRRVMVIDDDVAVCEIITEILHEWPDTHVTCVHDSLTGAAKLCRWHFDLALIDGSLPGLSGIQLAEIAANENTPVVILSGHPDISVTVAEFCFPHLLKPFSVSQLLESARNALAQGSKNIVRVRESAARLRAGVLAPT